jgi:hypothetical protein
MPILLAGTTEFVHIEQVSALFKFRLGQVLLYIYIHELMVIVQLLFLFPPCERPDKKIM